MVVSVPALSSYRPYTGIGRIVRSLEQHWDAEVQLVDAKIQAYPLPLLRNFPRRFVPPQDAHLVWNPRLTGTQALRNTQNLPSIVTVHDLGVVDCPCDQKSIDRVTQAAIIRDIKNLVWATHIIADSRFTAHRLLEHVPECEGKVSIIHAGVSSSFFDVDESVYPLSNLKGWPVLLYVGSELPRKNIDLLIDVFVGLRETYSSAILLKVGSAGHPRWRQKTLAAIDRHHLRLGKDVHIIEGINDNQLARLYHFADLFVTTSLYEGFGLPVLEALAAGTPVVVSDAGSLPELAADIGYVASPSVESFLAAVETALGNDFDRMKAIEYAGRFSWFEAARKYQQVFATCLSREML